MPTRSLSKSLFVAGSESFLAVSEHTINLDNLGQRHQNAATFWFE